jgi:hypothetical protein
VRSAPLFHAKAVPKNENENEPEREFENFESEVFGLEFSKVHPHSGL